VEIEGKLYDIQVMKRPFVDEFLTRVSSLYELVIFTASMPKYANPLLEILDHNNYCTSRLFRESCLCQNGVFIKDLSNIGRDLKDVIILDV
jgi:RNA polymerase II subunit A small phosphatase-like protein